MKKRVSPLQAGLWFGGATLYFFLLLYSLLPWIKDRFLWNPGAYWFVTGYCLFIPLFVSALVLVRREGARSWSETAQGLNLRPFTRRDWLWATGGLIAVFLGTGLVFGVSALLTEVWGLRPLTMVPWFMVMEPFQGREKLLLLLWLPMFFFNIVGEELLWRGYLQNRLEGKGAWLLISLFWMLFHLPFGLDLMIMLVPIILIQPYVFHKTRNTMTGIFIHGVYNGPMFVFVSLGFIG